MRLVWMVLGIFVSSGVCNTVWSTEGAGAVAAGSEQVQLRRSACPCQKCFVAESANFRVHCCSTADRIKELASSCEKQRAHCHTMWIGGDAAVWYSKCDVVVHRNSHSYRAELGTGSEQTSGCSTIQLDKGRVVRRRIDLRADAADCFSDSLPHELTHVVLAEVFAPQRIPAWADEGIAMLAESPEKLQRRLTELAGVMAANRSLGLHELMMLTQGPPLGSRDAFYGQSVTLTGLLLERGTPKQLLSFVKAGQRHGYDQALHDVYGIDTRSTLEREWRTYAETQRLRSLAHHSMPDGGTPLSISLVEKNPQVPEK